MQESADPIPPLIQFIASKQIRGFDTPSAANATIGPVSDNGRTSVKSSVSISMPPSPLNLKSPNQRVSETLENKIQLTSVSSIKSRFYSQPMPDIGHGNEVAMEMKNPAVNKLKDNTYDSFKTWSGKLESQISHLRGKQQEILPETSTSQTQEIPLPVDRYFDALEGPELDTLRDSEVLMLPDDRKWPFLLRFPVSSFGICLGVSSQAIMWKTLANSASMSFLHVSLRINLILWFIAIALVSAISFIYFLKIVLYFEAVRREYYHPIRVNFFFAPWIAMLFLALGLPPAIADKLDELYWFILMSPIFCLELKIYGQWMSGGQRRLSQVANPSNHLSIVGNFVGALLGASMGLKEGPIFFFAVGLAHYMVLFVTLYQRLPTNETLPKELHPVFFLFVAAPSVASMAWANIHGSFDYGSRLAYFIALFLYLSLAVRVNFFRGFRFSLAWWAYTFPMTGAAIATIRYSNEVSNVITKCLAVALSVVATLTVTTLFVTTIIHAFALGDLFPNDIAIAISYRRSKPDTKWFDLLPGASDSKNVEDYLKSSDNNDIGGSIESSHV